MKNKILIFLILLTFAHVTNAQLIQNGGFELGTVPNDVNQINRATGWTIGCCTFPGSTYAGSPDLCDRNGNLQWLNKVPKNEVETRNSPNNRYVWCHGNLTSVSSGTTYYGESILGTLTQSLTPGVNYEVSLYAARTYTGNALPTPGFVEVLLRKNGNCTLKKSVYITPQVPQLNKAADGQITNNWTYFSSTFTLTAAEAAVGYDKIEFRPLQSSIYIDDCNLKALPMANFDFVNTDGLLSLPSLFGNINVSKLCTTNVVINGGASINENSYYLEVTEFNLSNWTNVSTLLQKWITPSTTVPSTDINLTNLVNSDQTYSGVFQVGKVYKVRLGVGPIWDSEDKFIKIVDCGGVKSFEVVNSTNELRDDFYIYPNPANEQISLFFENIDQVMSAEIYDLKGVLVSKVDLSKIENGKLIIDIIDFVNGFYMINVNTKNGTLRKEFIKQ